MSQLLDQVRDAIRTLHYSIRTEEAYVLWARRFILFHGKRHPAEMGEAEVGAFLTHLAVERNVAASTQNQALGAILFLYREVLKQPLDWVDDVVRAKRPERLPVVLSAAEVRRVLEGLDGEKWLATSLMYGSGLRLLECLRLRVKDIDCGREQLMVRDGKGQKDRTTVLPESLHGPLRRQIDLVAALHARDLAEGFGRVYLPFALERKYPEADRDLAWQYVFPAPVGHSTLGGASCDGTTWPRRPFRSPCAGPSDAPGSSSRPVATPSGTASPPTCSKTARTSAPSRNCSATGTSAPR